MFQESTEKAQASADPSDPPARSINTYLQQPLERIQKYKAFLKVSDLTVKGRIPCSLARWRITHVFGPRRPTEENVLLSIRIEWCLYNVALL